MNRYMRKIMEFKMTEKAARDHYVLISGEEVGEYLPEGYVSRFQGESQKEALVRLFEKVSDIDGRTPAFDRKALCIATDGKRTPVYESILKLKPHYRGLHKIRLMTGKRGHPPVFFVSNGVPAEKI